MPTQVNPNWYDRTQTPQQVATNIAAWLLGDVNLVIPPTQLLAAVTMDIYAGAAPLAPTGCEIFVCGVPQGPLEGCVPDDMAAIYYNTQTLLGTYF